VSVTDEGLLRGDGAFEVLKLYAGKPFALEDHLDRLQRSCEGIFLEWDHDRFEQEVQALLERNEHDEKSLRLLVTRAGRRIAIIEDFPEFRHGVSLSSVRYQPTVVLTGLKTLSYAANMLAGRIAREQGADEALFVSPADRPERWGERGASRLARRDGARGAHLGDLLGHRGWPAEDAAARGRDPRVDNA
jgi:branched-chain amino acid aminotransferase